MLPSTDHRRSDRNFRDTRTSRTNKEIEKRRESYIRCRLVACAHARPKEARRSGRAIQPRYSWPLPALIHWEVKVGGTGMKEVRGAVFAGSSPPFLGRERAAVDVDVGLREG